MRQAAWAATWRLLNRCEVWARNMITHWVAVAYCALHKDTGEVKEPECVA
jgi:hypothetical protein